MTACFVVVVVVVLSLGLNSYRYHGACSCMREETMMTDKSITGEGGCFHLLRTN